MPEGPGQRLLFPGVSGDLTSTSGAIALAAVAVAISALVLAIVLAFKLRSLRSAQKAVMGGGAQRDLVGHAAAIQEGFVVLRDLVDSTFANVERRFADHAARLERGISHSAVVRYDAYNEMSGRQSSSMALLDDRGSGLVLSSILHREQARMYVKNVEHGESPYDLSPEEKQAIALALASPAQAKPEAAAHS